MNRDPASRDAVRRHGRPVVVGRGERRDRAVLGRMLTVVELYRGRAGALRRVSATRSPSGSRGPRPAPGPQAPSLRNSRRAWVFTVSSDRNSSLPISELLRPGHPGEHLQLALGQRGRRTGALDMRGREMTGSPPAASDSACTTIAAQLLAGGVLAQVAPGSAGDRAGHALGVLGQREHDDRRPPGGGRATGGSPRPRRSRACGHPSGPGRAAPPVARSASSPLAAPRPW